MNTTQDQFDEVMGFIDTKTGLRTGGDFAVTLKEGEVHVMCDIQHREALTQIFKNHKVQIVTLHTYLIGA